MSLPAQARSCPLVWQSAAVESSEAQGDTEGVGRAALREIVGKFVSAVAMLLGFLWVAWDPDKQSWHDKMAGTHVATVQWPVILTIHVKT